METKRPDAAVARLHPQQAGMLVGRGSCVVPVLSMRTGWHGQGEDVRVVCSTRGYREGTHGGRPQPHLLSVSPPKVPVAPLLDVQMMMHLIEVSSGRSKVPLNVHVAETVSDFVLTWEMGKNLCMATKPLRFP